MKKLLSEKAIAEIKKEIDETLRIRCINVTTTLSEAINEKGGRHTLKLSSTKFNTVPVLHSEIEIINFGSGVIDTKTEDKHYKDGDITFWIAVHASYQGNGAHLFSVEGIIREIELSTLLFFGDKSGIYLD